MRAEATSPNHDSSSEPQQHAGFDTAAAGSSKTESPPAASAVILAGCKREDPADNQDLHSEDDLAELEDESSSSSDSDHPLLALEDCGDNIGIDSDDNDVHDDEDVCDVAGQTPALEGPIRVGKVDGRAGNSPDHSTQSNTAGTKTAVRGIGTIHRQRDRCTAYYRASICIGRLELITRDVRDLDSALDNLMVLTTFKHNVSAEAESEILSRKIERDVMLAQLRQALDIALCTHNRQEQTLGLRFIVRLRQGFWMGGNGMTTPSIKDMDVAVDAFCRLAPFCHGTGLAGSGHVTWTIGFSELQSQWGKCKAEFVKICQELGCRSIDKLHLRIEGRVAARSKQRERIMQYWEQCHMRMEDPRKGIRSSTTDELRLMKIERLLSKWQLKKARQEAAEVAERKAAERRETAIKRKQQNERWRQRNRKDLTMGEILGSRFGRGLQAKGEC
eukprot:TRINITY_DN10961_c0_g2_i1.p1 TRINITY_DN10961_c0_g2~~TRINITY_DN10961_c0_g2_i1.p1  ORF type:complete len:446 (-),score=91.29 TRINITY_DN10961_c0_g2_i1:203-1540(-)